MNIAHNAQQKLVALEKQYSDFHNEKNQLEMQLHALQARVDNEIAKSKQLSEIIAQKEVELNEVRTYIVFYSSLTAFLE